MSKQKKRSRSKQSNQTSSVYRMIPDYRVEEDKYGRLINKEKRLIWPSNKQLSKKDLSEAFKATTQTDDSMKGSDLVSDRTIDYDLVTVGINAVESDAFIGGATSNEAEQLIGYRSFVLYYRKPDNGTIPYSMPLMLVYRSTRNIHYHFPVSQRKQYDQNGIPTRTFYKVECGDSLDFLSLETLIRHYETFVYHDVRNGSMETFPVGCRDGSSFDIHK